MNRYKVALAMGREDYERAVREDEELLREFGLRLMSVDQGVHVAVEVELRGSKKVNPWNLAHLEPKVWNLMRPLLVELSENRRSHGARLAAK